MHDDTTLMDLRVYLAICSLLDETPRSLQELERELKSRGMKMANGASRFLYDLETRLCGPEGKGKLFLRGGGGKGTRLTELGRHIGDLVDQQLIRSIREIDDSIRLMRPRIRIGMTSSLTTHLLPQVFEKSRLFEQYPDLDVTVVEGKPSELERAVESGDVDFAIAWRTPRSTLIVKEEICELPRVLLYSRIEKYSYDFSLFDKGKVSIRTLKAAIARETLLIPPRRVVDLSNFLPPTRRGGRVIELPQASLRRAWVQDGMGIAITHDEAYLGESEEHALEAIDLSEHLGTTKMSFYFSRTRRAHWHEAVQVAVEAVRQVYEAEGDVDRTQLEPRPELGERAQH